MAKKGKGEMTAREMGQRGGNTTKERYGHEFYVRIGHKGGDRVKELIGKGRSKE